MLNGLIKCNIKLQVTPEQSEAIQKICFKNGYVLGGEQIVHLINRPFLFIGSYTEEIYSPSTTAIGYLAVGEKDQKVFFEKHKSEEVNADFFIDTEGTCNIHDKKDKLPKVFKFAKDINETFDLMDNKETHFLMVTESEESLVNMEEFEPVGKKMSKWTNCPYRNGTCDFYTSVDIYGKNFEKGSGTKSVALCTLGAASENECCMNK